MTRNGILEARTESPTAKSGPRASQTCPVVFWYINQCALRSQLCLLPIKLDCEGSVPHEGSVSSMREQKQDWERIKVVL